MKIVIMAGGKGSRIADLFPDIPKPMIPITNSTGDSKPVLEWEIQSLKNQGYKDIILTVGYKYEKIIEYFEDGSRFGVNITYYIEDHPLGNAGALFKIRDDLGDEPFLLLNGDVVFDVDFNRMMDYHKKKSSLVTILTHPNSHPYDSGLIIASRNNSVKQWLAKEDDRPQWYKNRVNAGLHIIDPIVLDNAKSRIDINSIGKTIDNGKFFKVDLDRDILKPLCDSGKMFCYDSPEYIKDMGTEQRYFEVSNDYKDGIVNSKNLSNKQKAVFLDRDGTINKYVGFLRDIDEFELIDDVAESIKTINQSGYLCIVITNQPVIARGEVTFVQLDLIHDKMETLLGREGAYIDKIYFCPHHPDMGFDGEIKELKIDCDCRKPKPGMIIEASKEYNIDLSESYMIGDSKNDILCGKAAGCHTILISCDNNENYNADLVVDSLNDAVKKIINSDEKVVYE